MRTIPQRELGNDSGRVLAEVAAGETIEITNNGVVMAVMVPAIDRAGTRAAKPQCGQTLRTLDTIHVAHCLEIAAETMLSYDDRQLEAARAAGIRTLSPGR